jgi:hypothetical protein
MGPDPRRTTRGDVWPELPYADWKSTCDTLHLWTQIVGKVRLACTPWINHSWHATLYVTTRGLTTSPIPYGHESFELCFDFQSHQLRMHHESGAERTVPLGARSVADFYREVLARLGELGVTVEIHEVPNEIVDPIPFPEDEVHASYDPAYARRFWRVLASSARVLSAVWSQELGEFPLPYDAVRKASDPDDALRSFLGSTYDVAADLAGWDRAELEWGPGGRPSLNRE